MPEYETCTECGVEERRVELNETDEKGYLCDACLREHLEEVSLESALTVRKFLGVLAGILVIYGVFSVAVNGPGWYFDGVREAYEDCMEPFMEERQSPPVSCRSTLESTGWLGWVPWIGARYTKWRDETDWEIWDRQLRYVSVVEPSVAGRREALEAIDALVGPEPERTLFFGSDKGYLASVEEPMPKRRARYVRWMMLATSTYTFLFEDLTQLVRATGDRQLLDVALQEALEVYGSGPDQKGCGKHSCGHLLDLAIVACRYGHRNEAMTLVNHYVDQYRGKYHVDKMRRARTVQALCEASGEAGATVEFRDRSIDLSAWWSHRDGRNFVRRVTKARMTLYPVAALASSLARDGADDGAVPSPERLAELAQRMLTAALAAPDVERPVERSVEQHLSTLQRIKKPTDLLRRNNLVAPEAYEVALERLTGSKEAEQPWAKRLARVLRVEWAVAAARVGREEAALGALDRLEPGGQRRFRPVRAAVLQLFGDSRKAARIWGELAEGAEDVEPVSEAEVEEARREEVEKDGAVASIGGTLRRTETERVRFRLNQVRALVAAGDVEAARRAYVKIPERFLLQGALPDANATQLRQTGYALAFHTGGRPEAWLNEVMPAQLRPAELGEEASLRDLWEIHRAEGKRRRKLQSNPALEVEVTVPHLVMLGEAVRPDGDAEVFLDHVLGNETIEDGKGLFGRAPIGLWRRAEAARWRGDTEAAEAWEDRVFEPADTVDEPRDFLLRALL